MHVSSHNSFCEKHLSFAHYAESCHKAYAYKPRLNIKNRKREDINNKDRKGTKYKSQQEEGMKRNGSNTELAAFSTRQLQDDSGKCENDPGYLFEGDPTKNCDWAADQNTKERCNKKDKEQNDKIMKVFCPGVCNKSCK